MEIGMKVVNIILIVPMRNTNFLKLMQEFEDFKAAEATKSNCIFIKVRGSEKRGKKQITQQWNFEIVLIWNQ